MSIAARATAFFLAAVAAIGVAMAQDQQVGRNAGKSPRPVADRGATRVTLEVLPDQLQRSVDKFNRQLAAAGLGDPETTKKGVFNITTMWGPSYSELKVCFFSDAGSKDMRVKVAKIASEWNSHVPGLKLNFGSTRNPDLCPTNLEEERHQIRVTFGNTSWSLVGSQSVRDARSGEASMTLDVAVIQKSAGDAELRQTVLHEFGHAFGLEHEHQHPFKKCDLEYNWPEIFRLLAGPENRMSKDEVKDQMQRLGKQGLMSTEFDRSSVMLYWFPEPYFIKGARSECFNPRNSQLSSGDKRLLSEVYPAGGGARENAVVAMRNTHTATIRANVKIADGERSKALGFIDTLMQAAQPANGKPKTGR